MGMDFYPERARGVRSDEARPAPPRPDEDEMWEYVADHLRAIRGSLAVVAFFVVLQIVGAVIWMLIVASEAS